MAEMSVLRHFALLFAGIATFGALSADVSGCACDPRRPESLAARECSLCAEAEKQAPDSGIFFLKDINPRKPNRLLALPRFHGKGLHALSEMTPADHAALWKAAIEKAMELWGAEWGIAYNGDEVRTQCHAHLHIGKYMRENEGEAYSQTVDGPEQIPAPRGQGMWVHAHEGKLHIHSGPQITERVLQR